MYDHRSGHNPTVSKTCAWLPQIIIRARNTHVKGSSCVAHQRKAQTGHREPSGLLWYHSQIDSVGPEGMSKITY